MEFLNIPITLSSQFKGQFSAVIVHNSFWDRFEEDWHNALRVAEVHDCPVFIIADKFKITSKMEIENLKSLVALYKPVRVPELIDELEDKVVFDKQFSPDIDISDIVIPKAFERDINVKQT